MDSDFFLGLPRFFGTATILSVWVSGDSEIEVDGGVQGIGAFRPNTEKLKGYVPVSSLLLGSIIVSQRAIGYKKLDCLDF